MQYSSMLIIYICFSRRIGVLKQIEIDKEIFNRPLYIKWQRTFAYGLLNDAQQETLSIDAQLWVEVQQKREYTENIVY